MTFLEVLNKELSAENLIIAHAIYANSISRMLVLFKKSVEFCFKGDLYY